MFWSKPVCEFGGAVFEFVDPVGAERALNRSRQKRELIGWLRAQAANRSGGAAWFVVRTKTDSAESLVESLKAHDIEALCPMQKAVKRLPRKRSKVTVEVALFPRYLFVRLPVFEAAFLGVMTFDEVDCLLGSALGPTPIDDAIIEQIQHRAGNDGVDKSRLFKAGELARVLDGPFRHLTAEVRRDEGDDAKIDVEIMILGRMTACRIGIDDLQKLD